MSDAWVVNASPIIVLAKAGLERLLTDLAREVVVPEAVAAEVLAGPEADSARKLLESGWGRRAGPDNIPTALVEWGLGAGETAVIAVGLEMESCTVVLDDALGRSCARAFDLPLIGTLGIILRAKRRGLIPSAADALTALQAHGLHLDNETIRVALESVGEQPKQDGT